MLDEKFVVDLLEKVLSLPEVKAVIRDMEEDKEFWGELTQYEKEETALEDFWDDYEQVLIKLPEVAEIVKKQFVERAEWIASMPTIEFIDEAVDWDIEDWLINKVEEIGDKLFEALKKKHGKQ